MGKKNLTTLLTQSGTFFVDNLVGRTPKNCIAIYALNKTHSYIKQKVTTVELIGLTVSV